MKDMYLSCAQGKINLAVNTIAMAIVWNAILVLDDKYRKPSSYKQPYKRNSMHKYRYGT